MLKPVFAVEPGLEWKTAETANFYIHFASGYEQYVQPVANAAEQTHNILQPKLNWLPENKTHLVISDETDIANGYATSIHFNRSVIFISPPDTAKGLEDFDVWLQTLITHEYTHILHLDKAHGGAAGLRNIFGRHFLLFPNAYQPKWFIEGIASYYETDNEKGTGRGQSTLFEMMMRAEVMQGVKPVRQVNLPIRSWPLGNVSYLYGVYFYIFLEEVYGVASIDKMLEEYSDNIIPFMINSNSRQVINKNISELWLEYGEWLTDRYKLDEKTNWIEGDKQTDTGYFTSSIDMNDDGEVYYVEHGAFEHAVVRKLNANDTVSEVHSGAKINLSSDAGVLVTQLEYCDEYNVYADIYRVDSKNGLERLTECGRYRNAIWSQDGKYIYASRQGNKGTDLVRLDAQGKFMEVLWQGTLTDIVAQMKISPAGDRLVSAVFRQESGWNIEEFELNLRQWNKITNDRYIDMYPSYSNQGEDILFSSDRSGSYQVYRYKKQLNKLSQLTRVKTGAFSPLQLNSGSSLYYTGYSANGYDIYRLDNVREILSQNIETEYQYQVSVADSVEINSQREYSALESMRPRWWFPFISVADERAEYGFTTSANDALGIHQYFLDLAYDTKNKWTAGRFIYSYANKFTIGLQRSTDILNDINNDFAVARQDDDIFLIYSLNYPEIERKLNYYLGVFSSKTSDGRRAEGINQLPDTRDNLMGVATRYDSSQRYIRSISESDGRKIQLTAETGEVFNGDFSGEIYSIDWREYISLGSQHVMALRFVQGWGTDQPKLFNLGGESNDYNFLDFIRPSGETVFGKRDYALRGYEEGLSVLRGRRMQLMTMEWRFPGSLVERGWMAPPVGIIQWSGSVFAESGAAYDDNHADKYYSSAGIEFQADINLFYGLNSRMRMGIASGLDESFGDDRIYFMLGASF